MPIRNFVIISVKKLLQVIIMLYDVIYAINDCKCLAITYIDIVTGNLRKTVHLSAVRMV